MKNIEHFKPFKRNLTLSLVVFAILCSSLFAQDTNRALNFDGVNDYVNMNNVLNNLALPLTAEALVYWRGAITTGGIIASDNDPQYYYRGFKISVLPGGRIYVRLGDGGIAASYNRRDKVSPFNALPMNAWAHIAVVIRSLTNISIYVNGVDVGGTYDGSGGNMQSSSHPFVIGRDTYNQSSGEDWFFNGFIDEVRIWKKERTQPQIVSKMNQTLCSEYLTSLDSGLIGYWQLDSLETLGMVRDFAFDPHHGYIVNGPIIAPGSLILNCNSILPISLNLKVLVEGLYNQSLNIMARKDSMKVYLRNVTPPYSIVDTTEGIIDSISYSGLYNFYNTPSGTYYLVVKHFNSIETWSTAGGEPLIRGGSVYNYDFTDSAAQAYGNNMKLKGNKFCMISGDIDGNNFVDLVDILMVFNDISNFVIGSANTDLTGDRVVDLEDLLIVYNNSSLFSGIKRPW